MNIRKYISDITEGIGIEQAEVDLQFLEGLATNGDPANYFIRFVNDSAVANLVEKPKDKYDLSKGTVKMIEREVPKQRAPQSAKLGHNILQKSDFNTPQAIYAYPLSKVAYDKIFVTKRQKFGAGAKYLLLIQPSKGNFWDMQRYGSSNFTKDFIKLQKVYGGSNFKKKTTGHYDKFLELVKDAKANADVETYAGKMWNLTRMLALEIESENESEREIITWAKIIWKDLGYAYAYDSGESIIHSNEPEQIAIFDPTSVKLFKAFANPLVKQKLHAERQEDALLFAYLQDTAKTHLEGKLKDFAKDVVELISEFEKLIARRNSKQKDAKAVEDLYDETFKTYANFFASFDFELKDINKKALPATFKVVEELREMQTMFSKWKALNRGKTAEEKSRFLDFAFPGALFDLKDSIAGEIKIFLLKVASLRQKRGK